MHGPQHQRDRGHGIEPRRQVSPPAVRQDAQQEPNVEHVDEREQGAVERPELDVPVVRHGVQFGHDDRHERRMVEHAVPRILGDQAMGVDTRGVLRPDFGVGATARGRGQEQAQAESDAAQDPERNGSLAWLSHCLDFP